MCFGRRSFGLRCSSDWSWHSDIAVTADLTAGLRQRSELHTLSKRSTSPMMTASGASHVSGAVVGTRLPKTMCCRCLRHHTSDEIIRHHASRQENSREQRMDQNSWPGVGGGGRRAARVRNDRADAAAASSHLL